MDKNTIKNIKIASKATSQRGHIPSLSLLWSTGDMLVGTDLDAFVRVNVKLPAGVAPHTAPAEYIDQHIVENLLGATIKDMPKPNDVPLRPISNVDVATIIDMLKHCSKDSTRERLQGVHLYTECGKLYAETTDGYTMAKKAVSDSVMSEVNIIVPAKVFKLATLRKKENWVLKANEAENIVSIGLTDIEIWSGKAIDGTRYPDTKVLEPKYLEGRELEAKDCPRFDAALLQRWGAKSLRLVETNTKNMWCVEKIK